MDSNQAFFNEKIPKNNWKSLSLLPRADIIRFIVKSVIVILSLRIFILIYGQNANN